MFYILIKNMQHGSVGGSVSGIPLGPGFESQVPQYLCAIFIQVLSCNAQDVVHHMPHRSRRQMAFRPNLKARIEGSPWTQVNKHALDGKSQTRLGRFGPLKLQITPPLGPNTPLVILFFYLFYYLFTNYYYYLN